MPKWTEQQRDAIADRGHSLIVCAAAGSGKTAVLVERIVQLVREGCPIENMLVVTFTNAAAGEMRQRIGEALGKAAREDPALGEQVMAPSRARISPRRAATNGASDGQWIPCIIARTGSLAKRGTSAGSRCWACSPSSCPKPATGCDCTKAGDEP